MLMLIKKYLGQTMAEMGFVTRPQLDEALQRQKQIMQEKASPEKLQRDRLVTDARLAKDIDMAPLLGQVLNNMGFVTKEQLEQALQEQEKPFQAYTSLENEKLGIALEIGALVNSTLSLAEVLHLIMTHANRVTNSVASTLMLVDETTGELVFSVPTGPKKDKLIDIRIPPGEGIAGWVVEHEKPALVPNVKEDARFYPKVDEKSGFETKSMLCVPLKAKTKLIGVLEVINKVDETFFTKEDELLLSMFGYQAAVGIENARLYEELKEQLQECKQAAQALRKSEEKLTRAKKMEALGLLAGGVAHDLNNVLSGIVSYPELLLLDLPKESKLRKPIETIQETGHRATAIVQDLLTVARGIAIAKEPLNLNAMVENFLLSPEFEKLKRFHPTVTIKTNLDTDLFNISGSDAHLRKVVMNLVSNAAEAIEGSGDVIISTLNRYVDRPIRGYDDVNVGEYGVLSVSDGGPGISPDDLERIFEPFYTKKVMGRSGTGLGLAVVWNVVQDLKGYLDVISDENGTTFELYFPTTREEVSDKDLSIPIKDYQGDGEKVLVVDDVESQREIACEMLNILGYKAKAVSSGEEAVEYLKENTVDLILLDMIMAPGINGRETYERILKIHPNQKAVIASGFAETDDVKEAQRLGAGQYIKKPLTLEKIGTAVKDELKKGLRDGHTI
jgi:signal transduction histidine kinase/ActR/RegA family two-component response regulator